MESTDIAIAGAGVIGCAIAYELSRATATRIVVLDRGEPGQQTSNAAAGVLAVASGRARQGALLEILRRSAQLFPQWVSRLQEESGIDVGYRREGLVLVAFTAAELAALSELVSHRIRQGMRARLLPRGQLLEMEPAVSPAAHGGALFPDDCTIDSRRFVQALISAAQRRGVSFRWGIEVNSVQIDRQQVSVCTSGGPVVAGRAVVAAGAWTAQLLGPEVRIPVRPIQGEMLALRPGVRFFHTLAAGGAYLVPRCEELLVGSTVRAVGFDWRVRAGGVATLLGAALRMAPALATAPVLRWWSGLRPCSTIRRPIIAPLPGRERVIVAAGHHRSGILLAPVTASLVRALITGAAPEVPVEPFAYRRR